jgi:membrane fusion protein, heavy metal efflux system
MSQRNRLQLLFLATSILAVQMLTASPAMAGSGHSHGKEFKDNAVGKTSIAIDQATAQQAGIRVAAITPKPLELGLTATGKIELAADRQSLVTAPVSGKIVALLVEPGATVRQGQPLATLTSPELADLRISTQSKRSELWANYQQAQASLQLATTNYQRYRTIAAAELNRAKDSLTAAQAQYNNDQSLVQSRSVVKAAQENYQRQLAIAKSETAQAQTEVAVAQERYTQDQRLAASGALPRRQVLESQAALSAARTKLTKAQQQPEVLAALAELRKAEVELPVRNQQDSATRLADARSNLVTASTQKEVVAAEAELRRAQLALNAAKAQYDLVDLSYNTRLKQLGTATDERGLVTIKAPLSGTVSDITATVGQTVTAGETKVMQVVDDRQVIVTANIYERDLASVSLGQRVNLKVASLPDQTFSGTVSRIGTLVGQERVVPVQAVLENSDRRLKAGMFTTMELMTGNRTPAVLAVPSAALVTANGQKTLYVQSGDKFQSVAVTTGRTSGDLVEIKTGLFAGDRVAVQGAMSLYAQSLKGDGADSHDDEHGTEAKPDAKSLGGWGTWSLLAASAGGLAIGGLGAVVWQRRRQLPGQSDRDIDRVIDAVLVAEEEPPSLSPSAVVKELSDVDQKSNVIPYHKPAHRPENHQH